MIHVVIPPPSEPLQLAPKATEKILDELRSVDLEEEEEMELGIVGESMEIIPINLSLAINAPIDTTRELQALYYLTRNIMLKLHDKSSPGKPHPQLLGYIKESREQIEKIHKLTETIQEEANLEKLKIVRAMFEHNSDLSEELKIKFLQQMRNKQKAREGT